jgi:thiaminase
VAALAAQADEALEQSPDQQPRAGEVVVEVMELEADFWNMAYAP